MLGNRSCSELTETKRSSDPIERFHQNHCLLSRTRLAHRNCLDRICFPVSGEAVKGTELVCGQDYKETVRLSRRAGLSLKQEPVSAEREHEISAFECHAYGAIRELWIEIADAVEANQPRNNPMAPDLAA